MLGTVIYFNVERHFGKIQPDDGGPPLFVHVSGLSDPETRLEANDRVEFEIETQTEKGPKAAHVRRIGSQPADLKPKGDSCFIVMPYGRTSEEVRWFSGWYQLVIEPGVRAAGFEPILAAAQDRPDAINDEIRAHLALDPIVVVDLGGVTPDAEPNPNVMYELGIRHAFNLPHVIMAWAGQRLPFDISNQRTIMERRDMIDVPINRERLTNFIREASLGNHYRPMDAVGRVATLDLAERRLGPSSVLGALVEEVRDLRRHVTPPRRQHLVSIKQALGGKAKRGELYQRFLAAGGTNKQWTVLLNDKVERSKAAAMPDKLDLVLEFAKHHGYKSAPGGPAVSPNKVDKPSADPQFVEEIYPNETDDATDVLS